MRTYVGEYDETLVRQALERERARGGQAFYLHNRVETIDEVAERLRGLCPDAALRGRARRSSRSSELETRMMTFLRGDADVLVCTSIIESGIDIPAANTLVVEHADRFGLAQLYQIRGRVGRIARARVRLPALRRGRLADAAGGAAARRAVGLHRARARGSRSRCATSSCAAPATCSATSSRATSRRSASSSTCRCSTRRSPRRAPSGEAASAEWEPVRVDVDVDAYVPADYVGYEQAKIDVHRRIAGAREVADIEELREELADRFGPPPEPVEHLLALQRRAHQARRRRRARGQLPRRASRDRADRARLRRACASCAGGCRRRSTTPAARRSRCASPRTPPSASRRSSPPRTRCSRPPAPRG